VPVPFFLDRCRGPRGCGPPKHSFESALQICEGASLARPRAFPFGEVKINFARTRRVIAAGMIGNVLGYDVSVYGFFVSAKHFFPGGSGTPEGALYGGRFGLQHIPRGGLTPLVALWLVERTRDEIAAGVTFSAILRFPETYRTPFVGITSRAAVAYAGRGV
jgi:hypothetical protein